MQPPAVVRARARCALAVGCLLGFSLLAASNGRSEELGLQLAGEELAQEAEPDGRALVQDFGGRSVKLVRLPISFKLLAPEDRPWRLRLRLPISLGFYDLRATLEGEIPLTSSVSTITFQPGVQLIYWVDENWELKPFVEVGGAFDVSGDGGEAFLFSGGLTSLTRFPWRRYVWSIGGQVEYNNGWFEGAELDIEGYTTVDLGAELLFPVVGVGAERRFDMSVYAMHRRFLPPARFEGVDEEVLDIDYQHEVGLTFGFEPAVQLWGLKIPRVGVAYRWGEGLESWRMNFGFPF